MAVATVLKGKGVIGVQDSVAASATDSVLVTAVSGRKVRVTSLVFFHGDTTASTVTFNSKPAGAGTAITPAFKYSANGGTSVYNPDGFFETNIGEGLTVTTGAGSTTGIMLTYKIVSA